MKSKKLGLDHSENSPLYRGSDRFERSATNVNSTDKVIGILAKNLAGYLPEIGGALGLVYWHIDI